VYKNKALQARPYLLTSLAGCETDDAISHHLPEWCHDLLFAGDIPVHIGNPLHTHVIDDRWRLVQWTYGAERQKGTPIDPDYAPANHDDVSAVRRLHNLHEMMENIKVGMFEYDRKGVLVWGNDAFYHLSGHPRDSSKEDKTWQDTVFDKDYPWLLGKWNRMASGEPVTIEMRWKRPASAMPDKKEDTSGQWVLATCQPTFDAAGAVTSVSGCLTDIAAQKRSQMDASRLRTDALEKLRASEKRFSNFVELARVGIWMINLEGELQYANPEWCALAGHRNTPWQDVKWSTLLDEKNMAVVHHNLEEILRTKQPAQYQLELMRPWENDEGAKLPIQVLVAAFPEIDETGSVIGYAGTLTDITHLRWAEQLQKQRTDEAIEAKRQQEAFIDMTCHEIRNPLGAVVQCVDALQLSLEDMRELVKVAVLDDLQSEKFNALFASTSENIEILTTCCAHQKRIVDDILTMSKLDSKLLTVAPAPTKLEDLLRQTSSLFEADARKADVVLRTVRQPSLDDIIAGKDVLVDSGRLLQVGKPFGTFCEVHQFITVAGPYQLNNQRSQIHSTRRKRALRHSHRRRISRAAIRAGARGGIPPNRHYQ
jgi:PAS domain S-box-containing protein